MEGSSFLLLLVVGFAPFLVVAPLIGPLIDRALRTFQTQKASQNIGCVHAGCLPHVKLRASL